VVNRWRSSSISLRGVGQMGPDSTGGRRSRAIAKAAEATIRHGSRGIRLGRVSTKVPMLDRPRDLKGRKGGYQPEP
jgi:hypothetical protein